MATCPLFIMESVNLIVTDSGSARGAPGWSTHLQIQELKLPGMETTFVDHAPGGAPVATEIPVEQVKFEASFTLAGWTPDVLLLTALPDAQRFTANGLVRDKRSSQPLKAQAILEGRLGRIEASNFRKGDLFAHQFKISGITHYELYFGDPKGRMALIYAYDFWVNELYVGNRNVHADVINRITGPEGAVGDLLTGA